MMGLFGKKSDVRGRVRQARAQLAVEGLETRELMAANFGLVDTLNARDTINLQELNVIGSIQQLKLVETGQIQQVIADGQARTNALAGQFAFLRAQEQQAILAGNGAAVSAIRAQENL